MLIGAERIDQGLQAVGATAGGDDAPASGDEALAAAAPKPESRR
jgi:hypothetical protein